ncbi:MAG: hypothetical protein ACOC6C_04635, partial [Verrucomicrobiota bacterium]
MPNSDLISTISNNMSHSTHRTYEPNRNLITSIENRTGDPQVALSKFEYSNDPLGRRTERIDRTGDSQVALTNNFAYNTRSELTNALMDAESFAYNFDNIGNRNLYTTNGTEYTYLVNALNQYTNIQSTGDPSWSPSYDADGNMTYLPSTSGGGAGGEGWHLQWTGENRLKTASCTGDTCVALSFAYD